MVFHVLYCLYQSLFTCSVEVLSIHCSATCLKYGPLQRSLWG
ncbi:hypothetical protein M758_5G105500 [Ceratodon purpureus]|nr:hypothetical protein M758_5G105500 [Ceratodon purpureus]